MLFQNKPINRIGVDVLTSEFGVKDKGKCAHYHHPSSELAIVGPPELKVTHSGRPNTRGDERSSENELRKNQAISSRVKIPRGSLCS